MNFFFILPYSSDPFVPCVFQWGICQMINVGETAGESLDVRAFVGCLLRLKRNLKWPWTNSVSGFWWLLQSQSHSSPFSALPEQYFLNSDEGKAQLKPHHPSHISGDACAATVASWQFGIPTLSSCCCRKVRTKSLRQTKHAGGCTHWDDCKSSEVVGTTGPDTVLTEINKMLLLRGNSAGEIFMVVGRKLTFTPASLAEKSWKIPINLKTHWSVFLYCRSRSEWNYRLCLFAVIT